MSMEKYVLLHNMYDWLPPIGEQATFVEACGLDINIYVVYDAEERGDPYSRYVRNFYFSGAVYFKSELLLGPYGYPFGKADCDGVNMYSGLGEVLNSTMAHDWGKQLGGSGFGYRHFVLPFCDNNYSFTIIADEWGLSGQSVVVDNILTNSVYQKLAGKYGAKRALRAMTVQLQMPDELKLVE